jgi:hypothetical protein
MDEPKNTLMIVDLGDEIANAVAYAVGACEQAFGMSPVVLGETKSAAETAVGAIRNGGREGEENARSVKPETTSPTPALTDAEVTASIESEKCLACDGRKAWRQPFCNTDFAALTWQMRKDVTVLDRNKPEFFSAFRAALRHLQLNPTRVRQLPSRGGEWRYRSEDDLERANFKFLEHATCNVPGCGQRVVWYRTPNGGRMPVNLSDYQPHKTTCADPDYFQRKREERAAQTFARRGNKKKQRRRA